MVHEEELPLSTLRCSHCLRMESRFVSADERWPDVLEVKECEEESFAVFHHQFARRYERCPAQTLLLLSPIVFLRQIRVLLSIYYWLLALGGLYIEMRRRRAPLL